jgi:hypothetical protein
VIHQDICDGLDLRCCMICARHIDRFPRAAAEATKVRFHPMAAAPGCMDWKAPATRAADETHDRL